MKSSDYIVNFLANKGIDHFFGYQGTMIAHFVDSIYRHEKVKNHCCYNEQGAAFAAVGYAKATGKTAVAYATSGPGAANLISGVADAYYDSVPVIFITGQLNTYEYTGIKGIRQNGFQEMDVIATVMPITKYCVKVENKEDIRFVLEKAYFMANEGRPGPVLIDLPMNLQREEIDHEQMKCFVPPAAVCKNDAEDVAERIMLAINDAEAPIILLGNGIKKDSKEYCDIVYVADTLKTPIVTSMLGRDLLTYDHKLNCGHLGGGYGHRYANVIVYKKADLIVSLGCSLCKRQTAMNTEKFAKDAHIIRVDIDEKELLRKVHSTEESYLLDCKEVIANMRKRTAESWKKHDKWLEKCNIIKRKLIEFDDKCEARKPNMLIEAISECTSDGTVVCCDVGQHQVWTSQSFKLKKNQRLLFSGGHGAMGFALPAAIGAYYATGNRSMAICGDGAIQMNIQELQWVFREQVPVTIIVLNNSSLGLIQQQQDDIFAGRYSGSMEVGGYSSPDFCKIGEAYGIASIKVTDVEELRNVLIKIDVEKPSLIEVVMDVKSRAYPKTYFGEEMYNQRPYISKELMEEILSM